MKNIQICDACFVSGEFESFIIVLILALRRAVVRELVAMSNLGHCKDNDKSKAGLRGTTLAMFVTKNFMLLSNE